MIHSVLVEIKCVPDQTNCLQPSTTSTNRTARAPAPLQIQTEHHHVIMKEYTLQEMLTSPTKIV